MQSTASLEQIILTNLRELPLEKQQEVLEFTKALRQGAIQETTKSQLSLREIAKMPLAERHHYLANIIPKIADDFLSDPELTEFSILDTEDWDMKYD